MINEFIRKSRVHSAGTLHDRSHVLGCLIKSRNVFNVQTVEYDLVNVCSVDIDESGNFLLAGLSNGSVDVQGIQDPTYGLLDHISRLSLSPFNLHRVQWNPGDEQFFSMLDNHCLYLVDPVELRAIEKFDFSLKTNWSEWNPCDKKIIAVCGSESQVRLVDVCSGSSAQTIVLGAQSGLSSHRATRCLWSKQDLNCLFVGDNEGYLHVYDTRHTTRPLILVGEEKGQISGMSFTSNQNSIITSQGTENHLVQWYYDKCTLKPIPDKFKKPVREFNIPPDEARIETSSQGNTNTTSSSRTKQRNDGLERKHLFRRHTKRAIPLPVDAYLRCQFYVTSQHIFCPVPSRVIKSKEIYIYEIESGERVKTLKSEDILRQGVFSVAGLMPESLVLYVGGRGRLRVWSLDEGHQRKMDEKIGLFHQTRWESDEEM